MLSYWVLKRFLFNYKGKFYRNCRLIFNFKCEGEVNCFMKKKMVRKLWKIIDYYYE